MSQTGFTGNLPASGCWINLFEPAIGELVGQCGYDCALLDMEHSPESLPRLLPMVRAVQYGGALAIVRAPDRDPAWLGRLMDMGADGAMIPMVESAEMASRLAAAAVYAPKGTRGMAAGIVRASGYGTNADYIAGARGRFLLLMQVETRAGVAAVDEIATTEGIDCLFTGPFDLAGSLGHCGEPDHADTRAAVDSVVDAAVRARLPVATLPSPLRTGPSLREDGFDLVFSGSDISLLRNAMSADAKQQRAAHHRFTENAVVAADQ